MTSVNDHTCGNGDTYSCRGCRYSQSGGIIRILREHLIPIPPDHRAMIFQALLKDFCPVCGAIRAACQGHGPQDILANAANEQLQEMATKWMEAQPFFAAIEKYQAAFRVRSVTFDNYIEYIKTHPNDDHAKELHKVYIEAFEKWRETDYEVGKYLVPPDGNVWPK